MCWHCINVAITLNLLLCQRWPYFCNHFNTLCKNLCSILEETIHTKEFPIKIHQLNRLEKVTHIFVVIRRAMWKIVHIWRRDRFEGANDKKHELNIFFLAFCHSYLVLNAKYVSLQQYLAQCDLDRVFSRYINQLFLSVLWALLMSCYLLFVFNPFFHIYESITDSFQTEDPRTILRLHL